MSGIFNLLNRLGILSAARQLNWSEQLATTGRPGTSVDGVNCADSLFSVLLVQCREQPKFRTTRITFGSFTGASTYTVALDGGTPSPIADGVSVEATVNQAVIDLNADVNINTIAVAAAELRDGVWTLVLRGIAEADYSCAVVVATGTGTILSDQDATGATAVGFSVPAGLSAPDAWAAFPGGDFTVTTDNLIERFRTAGMQRVYFQTTFAGGSGRVFCAPAIEE